MSFKRTDNRVAIFRHFLTDTARRRQRSRSSGRRVLRVESILDGSREATPALNLVVHRCVDEVGVVYSKLEKESTSNYVRGSFRSNRE